MSLHLCAQAACAPRPATGDTGHSPKADTGPDEFAECVTRVRRGDQAAARELTHRLHPVVSRIVRAHRLHRTPHEDLVQETFMKLFRRIDQYHGAVPITHWVSRIARSTCIDHFRAQSRRPEFRLADLEESEADALIGTLAAPGHSAAEGFAARELLDILLARLPASDRNILGLFDLEERSAVEIGRLLGIAAATVKIRAFRARRRLRKLFRSLTADEAGMTAKIRRLRASRLRAN